MSLRIVASTALAIGFIAWLLGAAPSLAEEKDRSPAAKTAGSRVSAAVVAEPSRTDADKALEKSKSSGTAVYVPPESRGAVHSRTSGGARGWSGPHVFVLAPDHVGVTTLAQPKLAWFLSKDTRAAIEVSLIADGAIESSIKIRLPGPYGAGIHLVDLAAQQGTLEEGRTYAWYVALVIDPRARDLDVVASGSIERQAATPELARELASGERSYRVLARNGVWYDAIADLSAAIEAIPASSPGAARELRAERAGLLEQVGVIAAAEYDNERVGVLGSAE
ncbi:MAG: DUF928 domain-containing protein [Deltaproteobacteria bacterium]|nr:MAG: DUF928 domain-containing protein [Deltaproteobacteria bacterium]